MSGFILWSTFVIICLHGKDTPEINGLYVINVITAPLINCHCKSSICSFILSILILDLMRLFKAFNKLEENIYEII